MPPVGTAPGAEPTAEELPGATGEAEPAGVVAVTRVDGGGAPVAVANELDGIELTGASDEPGTGSEPGAGAGAG